jgi:hypothetical protein
MAFQALIILTGLIVGWIRKGSIWVITSVAVRWLWVLPASYLLQHISINYLHGTAYELCIVASYVLILLFCGANIKIPGILWTAIGSASNFLVLLVNGLRMPAYIPAAEHLAPSLVPLLYKGEFGKSIAMTSSTHLNFLADIFSFEIYPPSLISIGDILVGIGLIMFIQYAMQSKEGSTPVT